MSKRNKKRAGKRVRKDSRFRGEGNTVFHMDGVDVTLTRMPRIDGWVCRGGVHGDTKYNRRKQKADLRRLIDES